MFHLRRPSHAPRLAPRLAALLIILIASTIGTQVARAEVRGRDGGSRGASAASVRRDAYRLAAQVRRGAAKPSTEEVEALVTRVETLQRERAVTAPLERRAAEAARRLVGLLTGRGKALPRALEDRLEDVVAEARYRDEVGRHETAVELEGAFSRTMVQSLSTEDGTVGPILRAGTGQVPRWLRRLAGPRPVASLAFDRLVPEQKLELLRSATRGRDYFDGDIDLPGVRFRAEGSPEIVSRLQPNPWLQLFPWMAFHPMVAWWQMVAGPRKLVGIDETLAKKLVKKLYFVSQGTIRSLGMVEVHVREPGRASATLGNAFRIADRLENGSTAAHQHLPRRLPRSILSGDAVDRFRLVDLWRRANLVAELGAVLDGGIIIRREDKDAVLFDFLQAGMLADLNRHLHALAHGGRGRLHHLDLKLAAVGFRTGELYGDKTWFGFENRIIRKDGRDAGRFADALQRAILTESYGIPRTAQADWHRAHVGRASHDLTLRRQNQLLRRLHYNQPMASLLERVPAALANELRAPGLVRRLTALSEKRYGLKMLVYDWSKDPVLEGRQALLARVTAAQRAGLHALAADRDPDRLVQTFVRDSGLYEAFAASLGMR